MPDNERKAAVAEVAAILARHWVPEDSDLPTLVRSHLRVYQDVLVWVRAEHMQAAAVPSFSEEVLPPLPMEAGRSLPATWIANGEVLDTALLSPQEHTRRQARTAPMPILAQSRTLVCGLCNIATPEERAACERCGGDGYEPCAQCRKPAHVWVGAFSPTHERAIALCLSCEEGTRNGR